MKNFYLTLQTPDRKNLPLPQQEVLLERDILKEARHNKSGVSLTSRGKRYTFYWHLKAKRLMVKVHKLPAYQVRPEVETLAKRLNKTRACPICGAAFPRNGKKRFCSLAHAAKARKRRWRYRTVELPRLEKQRQESKRLIEQSEAREVLAKRNRRTEARRRQRATKKNEERRNLEERLDQEDRLKRSEVVQFQADPEWN